MPTVGAQRDTLRQVRMILMCALVGSAIGGIPADKRASCSYFTLNDGAGGNCKLGNALHKRHSVHGNRQNEQHRQHEVPDD